MISTKHSVSVLVVSSSEKTFSTFNSILSDVKFERVLTAKSAGEAKRILIHDSFDIVVINTPLNDEFGTEFALDICENSATGVLMLIKSELYDQVSYQVEDYGIYTISKPTNSHIINDALKLVIATNARLRKFEKKTAVLSAKMDEIRIVNRAKWTLINKLSISEDDAHRIIEKQAMDTRKCKRDIAEIILKTYEN